MFQRMELHPSEAPAGVPVRLRDFAAVQCAARSIRGLPGVFGIEVLRISYY